MKCCSENLCLQANKADNSMEGLKRLWEETNRYYKSTRSKRILSFEAMQFLQYSLQYNPEMRLASDELYQLDFIQNAYNDVEFTYPDEEKEWKLYFRKYSTFENID